MTNICSPNLPGSFNMNCDNAMQAIKNPLVLAKGQTFSSLSDFSNQNTWKTKIQALNAVVFNGIQNYSVIGDDPDIQTSGKGHKIIARENPPGLQFMLKSNLCDFKEMLRELDGGAYEIVLELEGGYLMGYQAAGDDTIRGFSCTINAVTKGFSDPGAIQDFYTIYVFFSNVEEFRNYRIVKPVWNPSLDLAAYMPVGLDMYTKTAYVTGTKTVVVQVDTRCGAGYAGLVAAGFEVVESNMTGAEIDSIVDNTLGSYNVLIDNGVGATGLALGEYAILRVKSGTPVGYLSNRILVKGSA